MEVVQNIKFTLRVRTVSAAAAAVGLLSLLFGVYCAFAFLDFFPNLISIRSWLSFSLVFMAMLLVGFTTLSNLLAGTKIPKSNFDVLKISFSWRAFLRFVAYIIVSVSIPIVYLTVTGQSLSEACKERRTLRCVNTRNMFVVSCGFITGVLYACKTFIVSRRPIRFPVIRQTPFLKLRDRFFGIMKESLLKTVMTVVYFIPVFYFNSTRIGTNFKWLLSAQGATEDTIFSVSVLIKAWVLAAIVYIALKTLRHSLTYYLTHHLDLPLPQLIALLETSQDQFVLELGLQDLSRLASGRGGSGVAEVFALSRPGGVPYNWNTVLRQCMRVITIFENELESSGTTVKVVHEQPEMEPEVKKRFPVGARRLAPSKEEWPRHMPPSPNPLHPLIHPVHNTGFPLVRGMEGIATSPSPRSRPAPLPVVEVSSFIQNLKNSPPVLYLFGPVTDHHVAALLENSQLVVWAVSALSGLSARALTEDKFGVVVNDLPSVITTLLRFQKAVKQIMRKQKIGDRATRMRAALLDACNRGIINIAITYFDHLDHLPLDPDTLKALRSYATQ